MGAEGYKRKLTAIMSADVAGYSRLMGEDEAATVRTLEAHKQVMFALIKQHRGRVVDSPGDNLLAEFVSVVDAVQCGVAVQKELQARNAELPENRRMEFRIGINLGDVIEEGERIYGDGVNIAARLESCADPGGICVSKTAFDHIETKLPLGYEYLGEKEVKNIAKPVGAYRVLMDPRVTVAGAKDKKLPIPVWGRKGVLAGALAVLIVFIGVVVWNFYFRAPAIEPASKEKMAFPLPDKPSIAVLPFTNMSDDSNQEYFSDGLAEEIITALSKVPQLFVIARNSTFSYKGKSVKVNQIAEELGVRYVLEGSVRKEGERVRITAQLIDALSGHHLWAERYERDLKDVFALQDEITMKVLTALQVRLTDGEVARISAKGTQKLEAYLKVMQARVPFYTITREGFAQARRLCEEALAIDPDYAAAYVYLGSTHFMDVVLGSSKSPKESMKLAFECLTKATSLDDSYSAAHSILGFLYVMKKQYDRGIAESKRAIALEPNSATGYIWMSLVLTRSGNHQEAVQPAEHALRLDPLGPPWWLRELGQTYYWVGRYEEAIDAYKKSLQRAPNDISTHIALTNAYSWAGRLEDARAQAREVLRINPKYCLEQDARVSQYKNQADRERYLDGLRKAGLPDKPVLPLPDKPSIAVLPFDNMSDDPKQEFFADGLAEEIINGLAKLSQLFVIARNSSFKYKGKTVDVRDVGRELGVRYVLEGSVRREAQRVRVTAQLIEASTGNHLFSERYDRELREIFATQDEITIAILRALRVAVTSGEQARLIGKGTKSLDAYLNAIQANEQFLQMNRQGNMKAKEFAREAIALDPKYAFPYAVLANAHMLDVWFRFSESPQESMTLADEAAHKALDLDETDLLIQITLTNLYVMQRKHDKAIASAERALELGPGAARSQHAMGIALYFACRFNEAIPFFEESIRLDPYPPSTSFRALAGAYGAVGRHEEALKFLEKSLQMNPDDIFAHLSLAALLVELDKGEEARAEAREVLRLHPKFSLEYFAKTLTFKDQAFVDRRIDLLRKAGLK